MEKKGTVSSLVDFDLQSGLSRSRKPLQRRLSSMKGMFYDQEAYAQRLKREDTLVYEFFDMGVPDSE